MKKIMLGILMSIFLMSIVVAVCGDNEIDYGELCDGTDLNGLTCSTFVFDGELIFYGGTLGCSDECYWNFSQCTAYAPWES